MKCVIRVLMMLLRISRGRRIQTDAYSCSVSSHAETPSSPVRDVWSVVPQHTPHHLMYSSKLTYYEKKTLFALESIFESLKSLLTKSNSVILWSDFYHRTCSDQNFFSSLSPTTTSHQGTFPVPWKRGIETVVLLLFAVLSKIFQLVCCSLKIQQN